MENSGLQARNRIRMIMLFGNAEVSSMYLMINRPVVRALSFALGVLMLSKTNAYAQYNDRQAQHAADVRAIQAQRDQHAANAAALNGDYRAADAYAHAAAVRRGQSYRDAGAARQLRYEGY